METICSAVTECSDLEMMDLTALVMDLDEKNSACAWRARLARSSGGLGGVVIVAAEIFWKFPEWKISGNFRKFPTSFFHFLTGYWKFILLRI